MDYYEMIRKGNCPECKTEHNIKVEETTEYEGNVPKTFTVIRCQVCGKSWMPHVLIPKQR